MIYILIFVLSLNAKPVSAPVAEFNSIEACQAASAAIQRQALAKRLEVQVLLCAAKGK